MFPIRTTVLGALLCLVANAGLGQSGCLTPATPDALGGIPPEAFLTESAAATYNVAIFFHLVVEDGGTGGPTEADLFDEINRLEGYYDPMDICFTYLGYDYIRDSDYASPSDGSFDGTDADNLVVDYPPISNVIDVYVLPSYTFFRGTAYAIPNTYTTIYAGRFDTPHLAHEVGHCLGLYHTHETAFGVECNSCLLFGSSNCAVAGDLCCDTPPDPTLSSSNVTGAPGCTYTGGGSDPGGSPYNPDVTNTMSYAPFDCRGLFTSDQQSRMFANLANPLSVLAPVINNDALLIYSSTYSANQSYAYYATDLDFGTGIFGSTYTLSGSARGFATAENRITISDGAVIQPGSSGRWWGKINHACDGSFPSVAPSPPPFRPDPTVLIENLDDNGPEFEVYPNPFQGQIYYEVIAEKDMTVYARLFDLKGVLVKSQRHDVFAGTSVLDMQVENMAYGVYVLELEHEGGRYKKLLHHTE